MRIEVIIFVVFLIVYFLATLLLRRYYEMKIHMLFVTGLLDDCFDTLNKFLPRILFPTYEQYLWRFRVHDARDEREMATRMIEQLVAKNQEAERAHEEQIQEIPREKTREIVKERLIEIEKGNRDFRF